MNRMPVAAIMYDFDRTLCTKDMQDYSFIPRLNMTEDEFWKFSNELGQKRTYGLNSCVYVRNGKNSPVKGI